jgi:hypothetical protein
MKLRGQREGHEVNPGMVRIHRAIAEKMLLANGKRPFSWIGEYQDRKRTIFADEEGLLHTVPAHALQEVWQVGGLKLLCTLKCEVS